MHNGTSMCWWLALQLELRCRQLGLPVSRHRHDCCRALNGIQVARYTHGLGMDKPLMVVRNGQTYFYHTDGLDSVVAITDEAGQVVQRYGYDAWGNIVYNDGLFAFSGSGLVNTLTYIAREYDAESGLYHYRARAYDPTLGRFLQKDPLEGELMSPQSQHIYSYAQNNPVNFTDPTGQCIAFSYTILASVSSRNCESMKEIGCGSFRTTPVLKKSTT